MKKLILSLVLLTSFVGGYIVYVPTAEAVATNCFTLPGGDGDYIDITSDIGHFRTGAGFPAWTMGAIVYMNNLTPGTDGWVVGSKRESTDVTNHAYLFDDGANIIQYQYGGTAQFGSTSVSATTFYLIALTFAGNTGNVTGRVITQSTGTQLDADTAAPGGSVFGDSEPQEFTIGGVESGGTIFNEFNGRICMPFAIRNHELSQSELEDFASDPLNVGDLWVGTYGTDLLFWFDDSGTNKSVNSVSRTLVGSVTLGSGNGPDVPVRAVGLRKILQTRPRSNYIPGAF